MDGAIPAVAIQAALPGFRRSVALIIGIAKYQQVDVLKSPVNDASRLAQILKDRYGYEVTLLRDQEATLAGLQTLFTTTLPAMGLGEPDRLLIYFAGHGLAEDSDQPKGYLIPQDAKLGDQNSFLQMDIVYQAISAQNCRHLLLILDCCFAGAFQWSATRGLPLRLQTLYRQGYERMVKSRSWQVLASAAADQKANDSLFGERASDGEHSPFAAALFEALEGQTQGLLRNDGVTTINDLFFYVYDRLTQTNQRDLLEKQQKPRIWPMPNDGRGEFVFLNGDLLKLSSAPDRSPYPGLRSFAEADHELFFGREDALQDLLSQVGSADPPLTIVTGPSGAGKSSLVLAGLLPQLRKDTNAQWQIAQPIRPGSAPRQQLAQILLDQGAGAQTLAERVAAWAAANPGVNLLVFIDQFEEFVTQCEDQAERDAALAELAGALSAQADVLRVVVAVREDIQRNFADGPLGPLWEQAYPQIMINHVSLDPDALRKMITLPADVQGAPLWQDSLVNKIVGDLVHKPGALALLALTLDGLYKLYLAQSDNTWELNEDNYKKLQGAEKQPTGALGALCAHASKVYNDFDEAQRTRAQLILLRMVELKGGQLAARAAPSSELCYNGTLEDLWRDPVLDKLVTQRLVVARCESDYTPYVELAHPDLVQRWDKLSSWANDQRATLALRGKLTSAVAEWLKDKRNDRLWVGEADLDLANAARLASDSWLNSDEQAFVEASMVLREQQRRIMEIRGLVLESQIRDSLASDTALLLAAEAAKRSIDVSDASNAKIRRMAEQRLLELLAQPAARPIVVDLGKPFATALLNPIGQYVLTRSPPGEARLTDLLSRSIHELTGQGGPINSVVFSPKGDYALTGSGDGTARLWDMSGAALRSFAHGSAVSQAIFSPDGRQVLTLGQDHIIWLWTLEGIQLRSFAPKAPPPSDMRGAQVSFSANGRRVMAIAYDGSVRVWDLDGRQRISIEDNAGSASIWSTFLSPDGRRVLRLAQERASVWDSDGCHPLFLVTGDNAASQGQPAASDQRVQFAGFSSDSRQVLAVLRDGTVRIQDLGSGHTHALPASAGRIYTAQWCPNGQFILTFAYSGQLQLWNVDGSLNTSYDQYLKTIVVAEFQADGTWIRAFGVENNAIGVWNLSGRRRYVFNHEEAVWMADLSRNAGWLLTSQSDSDQKVLRAWYLQVDPGAVLDGHNNAIRSIMLSPDQIHILTGSSDGTARLWNRDGTQPATYEHRQEVRKAIFSADGSAVLTASGHRAWLWDLDGSPRASFKHRDDVVDIAISPDGSQVLTASSDRTARLWSRDGIHHIRLKHQARLKRAMFSPDGRLVLAVGETGYAQLWDCDGAWRTEFVLSENDSSSVNSAMFSPDGLHVLVAFVTSTTYLYDLSGSKQGKFEHKASLSAALFDAAGQQVLTIGDKIVRVWDLTGAERATIQLRDRVQGAIFSPDGRWVLTRSMGGRAQLWSVAAPDQPYATYPGDATMVAIFGPDDAHGHMPTVLLGDSKGTVRMWPIASEGLLAQAARRVGRRLDAAELREIGIFADKPLFDYQEYL